MSRRGQHMTWRMQTVDHGFAELQALRRSDGPKHSLYWSVVAVGKTEHVEKLASELNRARFTLFDIRPGAKELQHAHNHDDGTVGNGGGRVRRSGRKLPDRKVARRSRAAKGD